MCNETPEICAAIDKLARTEHALQGAHAAQDWPRIDTTFDAREEAMGELLILLAATPRPGVAP
jgi:hypothetical protein